MITMPVSVSEFCQEHQGHSPQFLDWALSTGCETMSQLWDTDMLPAWRVWVATRPGVLPDRDLRLLTCGCFRQVWSTLQDERLRRAVEVLERHANGEASTDLLLEVLASARAAADAASPAARAAADAAEIAAAKAEYAAAQAEYVADLASRVVGADIYAAETASAAAYLEYVEARAAVVKAARAARATAEVDSAACAVVAAVAAVTAVGAAASKAASEAFDGASALVAESFDEGGDVMGVWLVDYLLERGNPFK